MVTLLLIIEEFKRHFKNNKQKIIRMQKRGD